MWHMTKQERPPQGECVLCKLENGEIHEGHFIGNVNKYRMGVDRWRIYKYKKTVPLDEVVMWRELPKIGFVPSNNS